MLQVREGHPLVQEHTTPGLQDVSGADGLRENIERSHPLPAIQVRCQLVCLTGIERADDGQVQVDGEKLARQVGD